MHTGMVNRSPEQLRYALMMLQEKIQGQSGTVKQVLNLG
jgi:NADH:ubiquinone oxidoreductase subunit B-like Fe-S oxidoreductase